MPDARGQRRCAVFLRGARQAAQRAHAHGKGVASARARLARWCAAETDSSTPSQQSHNSHMTQVDTGHHRQSHRPSDETSSSSRAAAACRPARVSKHRRADVAASPFPHARAAGKDLASEAGAAKGSAALVCRGGGAVGLLVQARLPANDSHVKGVACALPHWCIPPSPARAGRTMERVHDTLLDLPPRVCDHAPSLPRLPHCSPRAAHLCRPQVYDVACETPMQPASKLSERLGNSVFLKREDLQPGFSFKVGAGSALAGVRTRCEHVCLPACPAPPLARGEGRAARAPAAHAAVRCADPCLSAGARRVQQDGRDEAGGHGERRAGACCRRARRGGSHCCAQARRQGEAATSRTRLRAGPACGCRATWTRDVAAVQLVGLARAARGSRGEGGCPAGVGSSEAGAARRRRVASGGNQRRERRAAARRQALRPRCAPLLRQPTFSPPPAPPAVPHARRRLSFRR